VGDPHAPRQTLAQRPVAASGDWDDVVPAIDLAASRSEMTLLRWSQTASGEIVAELRTAGDEPAWIVARRADAAGGQGIELRAMVGRLGDPRREHALIERVRERLADLEGVPTRPVR
jgi:hypothetical protein